jgi:hypothetical protein
MPPDDCNAPIPLTREELLDQDRRRLMLEAYPWLKALSDEELERSLTKTMRKHPEGADVWVFAYGSLIWNPTFAFTSAGSPMSVDITAASACAPTWGAGRRSVRVCSWAWTVAGGAAASSSGYRQSRRRPN